MKIGDRVYIIPACKVGVIDNIRNVCGNDIIDVAVSGATNYICREFELVSIAKHRSSVALALISMLRNIVERGDATFKQIIELASNTTAQLDGVPGEERAVAAFKIVEWTLVYARTDDVRREDIIDALVRLLVQCV